MFLDLRFYHFGKGFLLMIKFQFSKHFSKMLKKILFQKRVPKMLSCLTPTFVKFLTSECGLFCCRWVLRLGGSWSHWAFGIRSPQTRRRRSKASPASRVSVKKRYFCPLGGAGSKFSLHVALASNGCYSTRSNLFPLHFQWSSSSWYLVKIHFVVKLISSIWFNINIESYTAGVIVILNVYIYHIFSYIYSWIVVNY